MFRLMYVLLIFSVLFSGAEFNPEPIKYLAKNGQKIEPPIGDLQINNFPVPTYNPRVEGRNNWVTVTLIDSSANGYGMVHGQTRPLFVSEDEQWFVTYRQYCGEGTTHGQLGGASSEDGEEWYHYWNINSNGNPPWGDDYWLNAQARYPSVLATQDYPIAIWTEYTGDTSTGSNYGGRPYNTFDEFGWHGGSFTYPMDLDYNWYSDSKDLWVGSPSISEDGQAIVVYEDWTRENDYLFYGEFDDGTGLWMEDEILIFEHGCCDPYNIEDESIVWSPPATTSMDAWDNGYAAVGLPGYFFNGFSGESEIMNSSTFIIKLNDSYGDGSEWTQARYIPEEVFENIREENFPDYSQYEIGSGYDMKLDSEGNIHIVIQIFPKEEDGSGYDYVVFCDENGHDNGAGWYHFTIDFDNLMWDDDPESWNWEYSKVITGAYTWCYTSTGGGSYIFDTQAQLVFDRDDEELVYIVADLGVPGEDTFEDGSHDYGSQWSQDIFIFRSEDNGQSWWNPLNVSNTPSYIGDQYPLEEQYPHAFQWGMNEEVYFMYQMPNWNWNELGDPEGADYMNYVYVGKASFTDDNQPSYPWENCSDPQYVDGDLNQDQIPDILDIIMYVNVIVFSDYSLIDGTCQIEQADINDDESIDIFDVIEVINIIFGN